MFSEDLTIMVQTIQKEMTKRLKYLNDNYATQIDFTKILESIIALRLNLWKCAKK